MIYKAFIQGILIIFNLFYVSYLTAQPNLKIGTTSGIIDNSAILELASINKGFLLPRLTTAQMNAIVTPANGLMVYNTTDGCIYIYRTSTWLSTCSATYAMAWSLLGNSGTTTGTNFIGTTDAQDLVFKAAGTEGLRLKNGGNVGIGTTAPAQKLEVSNGNISLSNTGTAGELRFAEPSASGANYTAIKAGAQTANISYTLPVTAPTAGQVLSSDAAGNMSWAAGGGGGLTTAAVVKTVDESVTSSTTQQNDDVFSFPVAANSTYILEGTLGISGNDISMSYVSPSGTYKIYGYVPLSGSYNMNLNNGSTSGYSLSSFPPMNSLQLSGTIITGATGGTFQYRWTQLNSSATPTVVQAYSWMRLTKVL